MERLEERVLDISDIVNEKWDFMRLQQSWFAQQATYHSAYLECLGQMSHMQVSSSGVDLSQFPDFPTYLGSNFVYSRTAPTMDNNDAVEEIEDQLEIC